MKLSAFKLNKQIKRGFTLVEISIVLVIIGLLIGGVLRGQELINGGRVRNLISQQTGMQTAYYAFLDRYKLLPGNMTIAQAAQINGNAIGMSAIAAANSSIVNPTESPVAFNNMAQAGFISCTTCTNLVDKGNIAISVTTGWNIPSNAADTTQVTQSNSPVNTFGNPVMFTYNPNMKGNIYSAVNYPFLSAAAGEAGKPSIYTGSGVSSSILAEMDRKQDDGSPVTGTFRYSDLYPGGGGTQSASCINSTVATALTWNVNPVALCMGVSQL